MFKLTSTLKFFVLALISLSALSSTAHAAMVFASRATSYYPARNQMEGGFLDRKGNRLYSIQEYLKGKAPYVSVAMDSHAFPYGTHLQIPEIERYYQTAITFRVVDTGNAFRGKGFQRIDICTENYNSSLQTAVNQWVTLVKKDEQNLN